MNILMVTSEAVPFSKSGGLADVVGALPPALNAMGHDCRIVVPAYNMNPSDISDEVCSFSVGMLAGSEKVSIRTKKVNGTDYLFVCHPFFCNRKGIYGDTSFAPYSDNFERFTVLSKAAIELCLKMDYKPDIIHCHDWTTGLLPYFLKQKNDPYFAGTKTVFTIHNLAYQGTSARMDFLLSGTEPDENLFFNGQVNMLRAGLIHCDYITTVSPTYAEEIKTPAQGCGLENVLLERSKYLSGIVNGIDVDEWNPETDKLIDTHFSIRNLKGKAKLKAQIQKEFNLPEAPDVPLFAMISRLASQKGFDALIPCLEDLLRTEKLQFVIIGTGDSHLESQLVDIASRNENLSVNILFSNKAAHLVEAGSDFFLMPSRYEPCGLNQLYSLRYGTLPVARRTGGLADTISDLDQNPGMGTGYLFDELTSDNIAKYVRKAVELYKRNDFDSIRKRAMDQDFSWKNSASKYIEVFEKLTKKKHKEV